MPVLLLFFCSGATALIYEVIWSNYLKLMMGSTVQAQTVVLAVFMGGLALGNRIFGKWADSLDNPLRTYGYVEIAIGVYAFLFAPLYKLADMAFVGIGPAVLEHSALLLAFKGFLSVALLAIPTVLMGGSLPLIAAWLQKTTPDARRFSARFYSINSLGAVAGAGLAGFFLVSWIGLSMTILFAGSINLLVGLAAMIISGCAAASNSSKATKPREKETPSSPQPSAPAPEIKLAICLVTLTGGVSMGLEILAARSLILIFGGSLQAFSIVLMSFILGIGIGASVIASPRIRQWPREATTFVLLLSGAALIGIYVMSIESWVEAYRWIKSGLAPSSAGYVFHLLINAGVSLIVLGIPAGILGAVLPLWIRESSSDSANLGHSVGRLLTWNTLGAVAGVLLTGFVLMPAVGLRGSLALLAFLLIGAAAWVGWSRLPRNVAIAAPGAIALGLAFVVWTGGETWKTVLSSGVFRFRETVVDTERLERRKQLVELLFYEDGTDATVSVERSQVGNDQFTTVLRINGKPDASSRGDMSTQYLLAHIPMLARPDAKDVFVLGFGSGVTAGALLGHPIERLDIAENCEPVIRAAPLFSEWNRGVHTNKVARIWNEDARTILKLSDQRYDVIISEPSNPWTVGVGSVFSQDFYKLAAQSLKPKGVMTQWFHVYEMHDGIMDLVLSTFSSVFPYVEIWDPGHGDIILLGAMEPWPTGPEIYRQVFERPEPRDDLESIGLKTPESILARQLASQRTAFAITDGVAFQSDEFPILEYAAPKAFFLGLNSQLLFLFDERTWQSSLAPPDKRAELGKFTDQQIDEIFTEYRSVNQELTSYANQRAARKDAAIALDFFNGAHPAPIIFSSPGERSKSAVYPAGASETFRFLLDAESTLIRTPAAWLPEVDRIEEILRQRSPDAPPEVPHWSPAHYASLAARTCMSHGTWARARKLVELGLTFEDARELNYLKRILDRVETLSPGATQSK